MYLKMLDFRICVCLERFANLLVHNKEYIYIYIKELVALWRLIKGCGQFKQYSRVMMNNEIKG